MYKPCVGIHNINYIHYVLLYPDKAKLQRTYIYKYDHICKMGHLKNNNLNQIHTSKLL